MIALPKPSYGGKINSPYLMRLMFDHDWLVQPKLNGHRAWSDHNGRICQRAGSVVATRKDLAGFKLDGEWLPKEGRFVPFDVVWWSDFGPLIGERWTLDERVYLLKKHLAEIYIGEVKTKAPVAMAIDNGWEGYVAKFRAADRPTSATTPWWIKFRD